MKYHLVIFYSEGPPHDNALPLEDSYKKLMENEDVKKEFDEVHVYTPRILKSMGYVNYLSTLKNVDGVIGNSSSGLLEALSTPRGRFAPVARGPYI